VIWVFNNVTKRNINPKTSLKPPLFCNHQFLIHHIPSFFRFWGNINNSAFAAIGGGRRMRQSTLGGRCEGGVWQRGDSRSWLWEGAAVATVPPSIAPPPTIRCRSAVRWRLRQWQQRQCHRAGCNESGRWTARWEWAGGGAGGNDDGGCNVGGGAILTTMTARRRWWRWGGQ
jgi:hypothetical protein